MPHSQIASIGAAVTASTVPFVLCAGNNAYEKSTKAKKVEKYETMSRDRSKKNSSYYHEGYEYNKKRGSCACAYTQGGRVDQKKENACRARMKKYIDEK